MREEIWLGLVGLGRDHLAKQCTWRFYICRVFEELMQGPTSYKSVGEVTFGCLILKQIGHSLRTNWTIVLSCL